MFIVAVAFAIGACEQSCWQLRSDQHGKTVRSDSPTDATRTVDSPRIFYGLKVVLSSLECITVPSKSARLFAAAVLGFSLVACGGASDPLAQQLPSPAPIPPTPAPTPTPAPAPTPTPAPPPSPGPSPSPAPVPSPTPAPSPAAAAVCPTPVGRVLEVGQGKTYPRPSAAAAVAQNGDTIHIAAGDYRADATTWRASNITICGIGGRARLFADGVDAQGKGIWVISTPNSATTTIVNVEFHDAKVADQNGAGIRLDGGSLVLRNTGFYDNENGILGGSGAATVTIENSEFARNGFGDGQTHGIYIGELDRLNVRSSFFYQTKIGHNLKSRAKENYIENSYFMDGPTGSASYQLDFPNGGLVFMRGNLIHKGPNADNTTSVAYGFERNTWPVNTVTLIHNTFASTLGRGTFVGVAGFTTRLTLTANLFAGSGAMSSGVSGAALVQQSNVATPVSSLLAPDNVSTPSFWPVSSQLAQLQLASIPDTAYVSDAPKPMTLRAIASTSGRLIGALQAAP
jgi:hypothetical protein